MSDKCRGEVHDSISRKTKLSCQTLENDAIQISQQLHFLNTPVSKNVRSSLDIYSILYTNLTPLTLPSFNSFRPSITPLRPPLPTLGGCTEICDEARSLPARSQNLL